MFVEDRLNKNEQYISSDRLNLVFEPAFQNLSHFVTGKELEKVKKYLCYECYQSEWNKQKKIVDDKLIQQNRITDSISTAKLQKRQEPAKLTPVVDNISNDDSNPYNKLQNSLRAFNYNNLNFTVFREIDYNYAGTNLSQYLQEKLNLASKDFKITETHITETFIPKASKNSELIKVKYSVTPNSKIKGWLDASPVNIINQVEISGTPNIIADLFIKYWKSDLKAGSLNGKSGVIAYKEVLGDYIALEIVNSNLYKITIGKGNTDVNYYTTYGINAPK